MADNTKKIPLTIPDLQGNEEAFVVDAIRTTWISSTGKYVNQFEKAFAGIAGTNDAISICNGTAALHLALLSMNVRPGDEVIVPSLTYIATANAVRYVGAEPVFVDVTPETWCMDPDLVELAITRQTKGIIAVDLYGHPADMDAINHIAAIHGLWVIEDAAEAHTARYKGRLAGSLAKVGTFSFYGNKIFTSGEGGAITLNDQDLALRIRTLRGQGMDPNRRYYFPITGYNFRLNNVSCAILCAQLERATSIVARRQQIFDWYRKELEGVKGIGFQPVATWAEPAPWLFSITIDRITFGCNRDELAEYLDQNLVETRPFFIPLHTLPPFRNESKTRGEHLPVTDQLAASGINLPTYTSMTEETVVRICNLIKECQKKRK
jgi:perosamine synthetase